jgi:hypothetical protein
MHVWLSLFGPQLELGKKLEKLRQDMVAHTISPSNSGGRDEEDCNSMPVQTKSLQDPISTTITRRFQDGG